MSVINKMLRDLDHRHAPESGLLPARAGQDPRTGTASISTLRASASRTRVLGWLGLLLVAAGLFAVAGWWWQRDAATQPMVVVSAVPVPAAVLAVAPPVAVTLPQVAVHASPATMASAPPVPLLAPIEKARAPAIEPVRSAQPTNPATVALHMDSTLSLKKLGETKPAELPVPNKAPAPVERPGALPAAVPTVPPQPSPDPVQLAQRQQQAGKDAIAHAQSLWNSGSHEAAIELMTDVVATAERVALSTPTPANLQLLVLPVRELTRMQLAQAQPQAVWDLLTRLEPQLGNQADLWAVRANAAQRLGRHQDSVHAYMTALQSRPNEQRWLLGAAVSLAALGKTASAADMAEKARAMGVVSKDVLAYLRQMGVPIKD